MKKIATAARTAALTVVGSTNKALVLAALLGAGWAVNPQAVEQHVTPTTATVTLLVSLGADLSARAWWRYGYRPEPLTADEVRPDIRRTLTELGMDPAEIDQVLVPEPEDDGLVHAEDAAHFAHALGRCDCPAGTPSVGCPLVAEARAIDPSEETR
ncbi:hypothetical protein [Kitasatospora sp. NPDC059160]|uniref:hypothetical protein n=1 Tax=Kitasatospora sp. NPDC059160 TaxID=3346748 RepID=UPI0036969C53